MKFLLVIALLFINSVNAKEYLGFNLCSKMTEAQIAKVTDIPLEKIEGLRQIPEEQVFAFGKYPVGKEFLSIYVKTFKDFVYEISFDTFSNTSLSKHSPTIEEIIEKKYGFISNYTKSVSNTEITTFVANTKATDSNLELTLNVQKFYFEGKLLRNAWVIYKCIPVDKNLQQALKAIEMKKIKDAEGNTKF